jgi:hypothetical protein
MVDTLVAKRVHGERGHVLDSEWSGRSATEVCSEIRERCRQVPVKIPRSAHLYLQSPVPKGRPECSPGRQSWVNKASESSPVGTAESSTGFNRP